MTFHPRKSHLWTSVGLMAALVLMSLIVMLNLELVMHKWLRLASLILGFLGVTLFAYGLAYTILRAMRPQAVLEASEDGLFFNGSIINNGTVQWDNIKEYGLVKYGGRKIFLIVLKSPDRFLRAQTGLRARHLRLKQKRFGTPVAFPANLLEEDVLKVMEELSKYKS